MVSAFLLKLFEDDLENFAVGNRMAIITEVAVCRGLLINAKTFNGIEVDAFFLKL